MAEHRGTVMPPASDRGGRRPLITGLVVVAAAVVGAVVVVGVWRSTRSPDPVPAPSATGGATASGAEGVSGCTGGSDPAAAVQTALAAPATPEGAAEAAAGVVRFTQSKAFGEPAAAGVIAKIADRSGAGQLVALQKGQAQYLSRMTISAAHTGQGAFSSSPDPLSPTVTVVTPVEWSTGQAQHLDWTFVDVRLLRDGDRWTVISSQSTTNTPDGLGPLRGSDARQTALDRFNGTLTALGFRRYSGDC